MTDAISAILALLSIWLLIVALIDYIFIDKDDDVTNDDYGV